MIGDNLKEARKSRNLTLTDLANRIGVTEGHLSKLERNLLEPSLPMLRALTDALGLTASEVFLPEKEERVFVVKKIDRPTVQFANLAAPCEILTPCMWRGHTVLEAEALRMRVPAGSNICNDNISFDYDEFIYIANGELEYRYGDEVAHIRKGGGIFVPRRTAHRIRNMGEEPADIIWIARTTSSDANPPPKAKDGVGYIVRGNAGDAVRGNAGDAVRGNAGNAEQSNGESAEKSNAKRTEQENKACVGDDALNRLSQLKFLGERIRNLRTERGLSVSKFAAQIGMTAAYVSKTERNLLEPSLPVLRRVAEFFGVEMAYLFADVFPADVLISDERDDSRVFMLPDSRVRLTAMTPSYLSHGGRPGLFTLRAQLGAGKTDTDGFAIHDYMEFTTVLTGVIEYRSDGNVYRCEAGDSIYIERNVPHQMYNPGDGDCTMLVALGSIAR
jgi:transcriptional regulator with XRE-family HTH domain/quercetin dioxygenase-like cupin family protein